MPAEGIVGKVGIYQRVPEPTRAILPRNHQVLDEKLATIIPTLFGFETISCLVVFCLATDDPFIFGPRPGTRALANAATAEQLIKCRSEVARNLVFLVTVLVHGFRGLLP